VLRLPLPVGKLALQEVISMFAGTGRVGKETIVKRGKLLMGTRVLFCISPCATRTIPFSSFKMETKGMA